MAVSKPRKATAKHTYTERVLRAFSDVQRKRRKHAIHMNSLKNQVKKNAEADEDILGPKWPKWVSKAVHRLEDKGILAPTPLRTIVMTPDGKRAVNLARKSLSTTSPKTGEELLWKTVAHAPKSRSYASPKRRRSSAVQSMREESGEDEYVPPRTPRRRAKRARTSLPSGKKPISQMTKAELQDAFKNMEVERANALLRSTSPLTDLDEVEETENLRERLRARDEEIENMRHQLDLSRSQTAPPRSGELDLASPGFSRDVPSSPSAHTRPVGGVVRTQSGSLICDVSKRPTPAPSTPGVDVEGLMEDDTENGDLFGDYGESMETPGSTTLWSTFGAGDGRLLSEVARLKASAKEAERANEEKEHAYRTKVSDLEKALESRQLTIQEQKDAHRVLLEQFSQLERQYSDRDIRVSALEEEIRVLGSRLSSASSEIVSKGDELKLLQVSKDALELTLADRTHMKADLENSLAAIRDELARKSVEFSESIAERKSLEERLANEMNKNVKNEAALSASSVSVNILHAHVTERDEQITELSRKLESAQKDGDEMREKIASMQMTIDKLQDELTISTNNHAVLTTTYQIKCNEYDDLFTRMQETEQIAAKQSEELRAEIEKLTHESKVSEESYELLVSSLSEEAKRLQNIFDEAKSTISAQEAQITDLKKTVESSRVLLANSQEKLAAAEAESRKHESSIAAMQESLSSARRQIDGLSNQLRSKQAELHQAQDDLNVRTKELSGKLIAESRKATSLETKVSELRTSKKADEETIRELKEIFVRLRDAQMHSLEEMGNKIQSTISKTRPPMKL